MAYAGVVMKRRKKFFSSHAKSSALVVSMVLHAVLVVVALSFVAVTVIQKQDQTFETAQVKRPRIKLKKLTVPVNIKKKKIEKPKLRKAIIAKPKNKSIDIKMPEIAGFKGGAGYLDGGGGLGSLGFGLEIDLFGGSKGSGNELEGTFYDLKMKPDGSPAKMDENYYNEVIQKFIGSWNLRTFDRYFKAPKKKFATFFMIPNIPADEAPKAYAVDDVVKPKQWVAYYKGKIAAPESGRYRFWGIADDILMVRVKKDLVLDANLNSGICDWQSKDERSRKFGMSAASLEIGDWFFLGKGRPADIEVLIGERPGGVFYTHLLIEQDGVDYPKGADGRPILPIFKTAAIPEKLIPQMKLEPNTCSIDGPVFGVLK
jgi:hypothetical protein